MLNISYIARNCKFSWKPKSHQTNIKNVQRKRYLTSCKVQVGEGYERAHRPVLHPLCSLLPVGATIPEHLHFRGSNPLWTCGSGRDLSWPCPLVQLPRPLVRGAAFSVSPDGAQASPWVPRSSSRAWTLQWLPRGLPTNCQHFHSSQSLVQNQNPHLVAGVHRLRIPRPDPLPAPPSRSPARPPSERCCAPASAPGCFSDVLHALCQKTRA